MSLKSALAELTKSDNGESITKGWVGSSRFLVLIAFALVLYYARSLFTTELWIILASVVGVYMICNTVTRIFEIKEEGAIVRERQRLAWTDGVLTAQEVAALESADRIVGRTASTPAIPTPSAPAITP
jgi:hypothetical protein